MTAHETAREIRSRFRTLMNGMAADTMRRSGLRYHVNWGVSLRHLRELASEYEPDIHVALELWGDDVRESKICALMLMPPADFSPDVAVLWSETLLTHEIATIGAKLLYCRVPFAPQMAFSLIADADELRQTLGWNIVSCLVTDGALPDARGLDELSDQMVLALSERSLAVRHSAYNCFRKLSASDKLAETPAWHALCENVGRELNQKR